MKKIKLAVMLVGVTALGVTISLNPTFAGLTSVPRGSGGGGRSSGGSHGGRSGSTGGGRSSGGSTQRGGGSHSGVGGGFHGGGSSIRGPGSGGRSGSGHISGGRTGGGRVGGQAGVRQPGGGRVGGHQPGSGHVNGQVGGHRPGSGHVGGNVGGHRPGSGHVGGNVGGHRPGSGHVGGNVGGHRPGSGHVGGNVGGHRPGSGHIAGGHGGGRHPGGWNHHPWHNQWHHGHWGGHWVGGGWGGGHPWRWGRPWGWGWGGPLGWGLTGYGGGYYNPYCGTCGPIDVGDGVVIDYSHPLDATVYVDPTVETDYESGTPLVTDAARTSMDSARAAFYQGDYNLALQHVNTALAQMPRDPAIHEFRALVLFALARYGEAATTLNAVLAVGPGWNWTTMSALYPDVAVYTAQLRALEAYSRQSPQAADGHFLLAYHYLTEGYPEASVKQFQQVVQLAPRDTVAAQLLQQLSPQSTAGASETPPVTPPVVSGQSTSGGALTAAQLVGTWKASLPDGTSFTLTLDADSNFTWTFTQKGKSTDMSGTYTLGRTTLLLEDPNAGPMSGQVSLAPDGALSFRIAGAPAGQGEIVFRR